MKRDQSQTIASGHLRQSHDNGDGHDSWQQKSSSRQPEQQQQQHQLASTRVTGNSLKRMTTITKKVSMGCPPEVVKQQQRQSNNNFRQLAALLVTILVVTSTLPNYQIYLEAKMHHSKRQAPTSGQLAGDGGPTTSGGRESSNWWNLWWQQYISEAAQPTVRPIVAVSFNGRSINLSDQTNLDSAGSSNSIAQYQGENLADVDTNLVFNGNNNQMSGGQFNPSDIERSERLVTNQAATDNEQAPNGGFMDKQQVLLAHKRTMQHQMHWQSVKPTIIQPTATATAMLARDLRTNRQVNEPPPSSDPSAGSNLGIQMRASMNARQQRQQQPISGGKLNVRPQTAARPTNFLASPAQNLLQQQQMQQQISMEEMGNRFEQQQNQMVDYSEENEPDMEDAAKTDSAGDDKSAGSSSTDSSSSSMMQENRPNMAAPGMRKAPADASSAGQLEARMQDTGSQRQQQPAQTNGPKMIVMMGGKGLQPTAPTATGRQQMAQSTGSRPSTGTMMSNDNVNRPSKMGMDSAGIGPAQSSTRSPAPPTTTTFNVPTTTRPTDAIGANETPVTRGPARMTTSGGRVQLENGRPATSFRQQGTTNAARPPTLTTQARGMADQTMPTTAMGRTSLSTTMEPATTTTIPTTNAPPTTTTVSTTIPEVSATTGSGDSATAKGQSSSSPTATQASDVQRLSEMTSMRPDAGQTVPSVSMFNTSTSVAASSESTAEQTTTTLRPVTGATGNETSSDGGDDNDGEEGDDEDGGNEQPNNGTNLMNSSDESSGDDEDEEEETTTTTSVGQEQPTTAATPMNLSQSPMSSVPPSGPMTTRQQQQQSSSPTTTTTQQPSMTTIDIERLPPKGSTANNMRDNSPAISSTTPASVSSSSAAATSMTSGDISRIQAAGNAPQQQQQQVDDNNNANIVMMTIGQNRQRPLDEEMAITMPMDALMKMMNQVVQDKEQQQQQGSSAPMSNESPLTTVAAPTTTTSAPTTTTVQPTSGSQESTTESALPASTMAPASEQNVARLGNLQDSRPMNPPAPKRKLPQPPPPTPRAGMRQQPVQMQTNFIENQSQTDSTMNQMPTTSSMNSGPESQADRSMMMLNLENESVQNLGDEMMSGVRPEPKIELLNLDLMPIQRIMANRSSSAMTEGNFERQRTMTQPQAMDQFDSRQNSALSNGTTRVTSGGGDTLSNAPMEQVVIAEVEPGMRLRPPIGASASMNQQQQSNGRTNTPIVMSDMMSNKNQANTVYMIMLNTPPAAGGQTQSLDSMSSSSLEDGRSMPTTMIQRDQTRTTSQPATKTMATTVGSQTTGKTQMRTTQTTFVRPSGSTTPSGGPMPITKSPIAASTAQQQQQRQMMMVQLSKQTSFPGTTTTTTTVASTITTTGRPRFVDNAVDLGMQRQTPTSETDGSQRITTMRTQQDAGKAYGSPGATVQEQQATTTTTMAPERFTTASRTSQASTFQEDSMATTVASSQKGPTITTTATAAMSQQAQTSAQLGSPTNGTRENNQGKLQRLQAQPVAGGDRKWPTQQQQPGATKTLGYQGKTGKSNNMTSSFIPNKLRANFNKIGQPEGSRQPGGVLAQLEGNAANPSSQSPLTGVAIRQFGGANRMSVLGNQPVPFGRPAAMTMQSGGSRRFELPTFEYGPSIAVRRPDEPLANGQVPNCTLTGKNFCVLTKDYPMNEVRQAVERSFRSVRIMYEELQTVSDQELHKDDFNATNNQAASGKFACQTQVEMMRPGWAKDEITREWMLVVNTDVFPQRVRTESCAQPNTPCEFIAPFYDSTCQQRYSLHRMIAIDPHDPARSPQVAVFKFPAGCVCRVHPIRKTTTTGLAAASATTPAPTTVISSSTSKSIRRR